MHRARCRCPECRALGRETVEAGRELYNLLGLHGFTPQAARVVAWAIRNGVPEALPRGTEWATASPDATIEHLVAEILD